MPSEGVQTIVESTMLNVLPKPSIYGGQVAEKNMENLQILSNF